MSQHTPGPWFVLVTPTKRRIILAHDPEMPESPWNIAEVALEAGYGDYDPVDDNARLIAAAPELLEELDKAHGWLCELLAELDPYGDHEDQHAARIASISALLARLTLGGAA